MPRPRQRRSVNGAQIFAAPTWVGHPALVPRRSAALDNSATLDRLGRNGGWHVNGVASMTTGADTKEAVRSFWSRTPCGSWDATAPEGSKEYYDQIEARRYELEPFIKRYASFESTRGQTVLEIGVGVGTDHLQFARAGAELHGVDLTEKSIELVRRRLELEGLRSELQVADAEALPFPTRASTSSTPGGFSTTHRTASARSRRRSGCCAPAVVSA